MNRHPDTHWALLRLLAASALPVFLLMARVFYTGRITYIFLIWSLFLAWLPLLFAYLSVRLGFKRRLAGLWALAWLLFFPNAPYIITDIMHLPNVGGVPILYDVVMLFAFAMVGIRPNGNDRTQRRARSLCIRRRTYLKLESGEKDFGPSKRYF